MHIKQKNKIRNHQDKSIKISNFKHSERVGLSLSKKVMSIDFN